MTARLRWIVALILLAAAGMTLEARADDAAKQTEIEEEEITDADREHWSFQPVVRPTVPAPKDASWASNPIDRFVLAKLDVRDVTPQPPADRTTLVRRVTIDLTGMPPTPAEIDAFLADDAPNAYEKLVDRMLASPAHGERYAQFWLDLARWAETDGFEHDLERKDVWKYRDWVIDAFNHDLPYDEFVALQLAGDELRPGDEQTRIATGFCLAGPDMPDINRQEERKSDVLNELTATIGGVFLGLQMGCAQCHDHKFDPLSQADFYRLRAIFEPAVDFKGHTFDEQAKNARPSHLEIRGDFRRLGPEVHAAFPRVANLAGVEIAPPASGSKSTQRRLQLAQWLTRPDHPLTSRVIANRMWQWHFGRGLSDTPSDFGLMGDEPYHKELLDWLATELVRSGWSLKHLHRLIVTSATYRQRSFPASPDEPHWLAAKERDRSNLYWSRYPRRRLEGETLRDMMLAASGMLNAEQHGESVRPPLPAEVVQTLLTPNHWRESERNADHYRRSVYIFSRRNLRFPMFEAFDRPPATATCAARQVSTTAPQSLLQFNSAFSLETAQQLAQRVKAHAGDDRIAQITWCYRLTLGRTPTTAEQTEAETYLSQSDSSEALTLLCLAMFNASEFVMLE